MRCRASPGRPEAVLLRVACEGHAEPRLPCAQPLTGWGEAGEGFRALRGATPERGTGGRMELAQRADGAGPSGTTGPVGAIASGAEDGASGWCWRGAGFFGSRLVAPGSI